MNPAFRSKRRAFLASAISITKVLLASATDENRAELERELEKLEAQT